MISEKNKENLEYMPDFMLRDIIRSFYNGDISRLKHDELIFKISNHQIDFQFNKSSVNINNEITKRVFLPQDPELPFFAYGIFKPDQIAFPIIEFEVESFEVFEIDDHIKFLRDGVSFIFPDENGKKVKGYRIYFKKGFSKTAYFKISNKEPQSLYTWVEIQGMNAMVAIDGKGEDYVEIDDSDLIIGWNDPYFHIGLEILKRQEIDLGKIDFKKFSFWNEKYAFSRAMFIQMKYMLAYSMMERLAFLMTSFQKGSNQIPNILAESKIVQYAILDVYKNLDEIEKTKDRKLFSSEKKLESNGKVKSEFVKINYKQCIEEANFGKIIKFYYQIRNNITHRGKTIVDREEEFNKYLNELISIIEYTIKNGEKQTRQ